MFIFVIHTFPLELKQNCKALNKSTSDNIFDNLPELASSKLQPSFGDELKAYLSTDEEPAQNPFHWWVQNRTVFPRLSRMALNYLSIPGKSEIVMLVYLNSVFRDGTATSVDVERVFSKGRLILSHVRNRLSVQSTRALMCLGDWSKKGLVHDKDVLQAASLPDVVEEEEELEDNWDSLL